MSAAAAATEATPDAVPAKKGKKKLIIIIAAVLLVVLVGGGGAAVFVMKKKAAAAAEAEADGEGGEDTAEAEHEAAHDPKHVPVFVPLDPFTVNLADRDAERYVQIGLTLEVADAKVGDSIKNYMPAIRNNILLLLAQKTSAQLLDRKGKERLAAEIRREAVRPLGVNIELEEEEPAHGADAAADAASEATAEPEHKPAKKKKKKAVAEEDVPVTRVHFSNFIIQ
jgi:flagellar FliL protein